MDASGVGAEPRGLTVEQLRRTLVRYDPACSREEWEESRRPAEPPEEAVAAHGKSSLKSMPKVGVPPLAPTAPLPADERGDGVARTHETLSVDEVLDVLFPPIGEDGLPASADNATVRPCSRAKATQMDVIALHEELDERCELRSVRDDGICVQREELYEQCYDELIRQVVVQCPEWGLLLARIRDEMAMTRDSYKTLYDMAVSLGQRKVIQRDLDHQISREMEKLEYEVMIQQKRVHSLQAKLGKTRKLLKDRRDLAESQHEEEVRFIKKGNTQLANELKRLQKAAETAAAQ